MKIVVWNPETGRDEVIYEGIGDVTVIEPDTGIRVVSSCKQLEEYFTLCRASQPQLKAAEHTPEYDEEE
jgi:hypothetical protein